MANTHVMCLWQRGTETGSGSAVDFEGPKIMQYFFFESSLFHNRNQHTELCFPEIPFTFNIYGDDALTLSTKQLAQR